MRYINIYSSLAVIAAASVLTGCDKNDWNDDLKGFKENLDNSTVEQVEALELTLTTADYKEIASNSTNVALAKAAGAEDALKAVGTRGYFSDQIPAKEYIPAFLDAKYYYLNDGSSVNLTYKVSKGLPAELAKAAAAQQYTISTEEYQNVVWESDDNFIDAFAPSHPASKFVPGILADKLDLGEGEYCVVTYNTATQEPVFGNVGGGDEPAAWTETETIATYKKGDACEIRGVVTAICGQGYILTDKSGSILVYYGKSFDTATVNIGSQVNISGEIGAYNGGLQVTGSSATAEVVGEQAVTYPAPKVYTGAELDQAITRTGEYTAIYAQIKGTAVISGNYVNITIDGAEKAQGSLYQGTDAQKAAFTNGAAVTVTGYFITVSGGRYVNFVVTAVDGKAVNKARRHNVKKAPAVEVPTTTDYVLYQYNGSRWVVADGFVTLSPADYRALGQSYNNISAADAKAYLPKFLAVNYPYAKADATKNVMYLVYDSTSKKSVYYCDQYVYNGTEWTLNDGIETETSQFVMNKNKWIFDPTVYITLTYGRNQTFSATYYQACVDWVYENICVPLGDTSIKSGLFYVSKYGNNEYYSGTSAYQNNVDLRPGSAREQYAAGWEGYTDEEIVKTMKDRFFKEVFPVALAKLHPDAKPLDGLDQLYNITFGAYDGTETKYYVAIYKVTAPGTFEPVSCTWYE